MPYLKGVIKETFRMYPPAPILVARETMQNSILEGYNIPPKTTIRQAPVATVELILSNLLYAFDWELPFGMNIENIDTDIFPGITTIRKCSLPCP
ncbi:hypothetical protein H5410_049253 [Solanum commersonii]|uniref:Cytochrome P450 n=1 Tax=Solanum commersonii TaxID=4109 RepID=A0A9J5XKK0_SOLCO|nr:hypothetical protein H5410_049253 [Solanum commersonii]